MTLEHGSVHLGCTSETFLARGYDKDTRFIQHLYQILYISTKRAISHTLVHGAFFKVFTLLISGAKIGARVSIHLIATLSASPL